MWCISYNIFSPRAERKLYLKENKCNFALERTWAEIQAVGVSRTTALSPP